MPRQTPQTLLWTALPNGLRREGSRIILQLSAFVSPRLTPPADGAPTLNVFPDFQVWPAVKFDRFLVRFFDGAGKQVQEVEATRLVEAKDVQTGAELWTKLFPPTTPVRAYEFVGLENRRIRSYPVSSVLQFLTERYRTVANSSSNSLPSISSLLDEGLFKPISFYSYDPGRDKETNPREGENGLVAQVEQAFGGKKAIGSLGVPLDFTQAWLFHNQANEWQPKWASEVEEPDLDFHDVISFLGDYPKLLRLLGLVIELEVGFASEARVPGVAGDFSVAVLPQFARRLSPAVTPRVASSSINPRTLYALDFKRELFLPAPARGSDLRDGMLAIGRAGYEVVQVDVDGAVQKALNFAYDIARMSAAPHKTADTPDKAGLPTLRSAGLSVVRSNRAARVQERLQRAADMNGQATPARGEKMTLHADDVIRGYRVDVQELHPRVGPPAWRSLCQRDGAYNFVNGAQTIHLSDEGFTTLGLTQKPQPKENPEPQPDLYLHESLFRWEGWSLSAPRPGKSLSDPQTDGNDVSPEQAVQAENKAGKDFGLVVNFTAAKGTLPRLRFGKKYRLRARAVDLAGNSVAAAATDGELVSQEVTYLRFEPVSAPVVVSDHAPTPGESLERMVIRTIPREPTGRNLRHLAPPKGSQLLAETHGLFDDAITGKTSGVRAAAYKLITSREGAFPDDPLRVQLDDNRRYVVLPYLPDPLARGAAVLLEIKIGGNLMQRIELCGFYPLTAKGPATWPDAMPWRLQLAEINQKEDPDPAKELTKRLSRDEKNRILTVRLRQAEVAKLRLSSFLRPTEVDLLGIWGLINKPEAELEFWRGLVATGQHWMFTPFRELTLVHAVRQPLVAPELDSHAKEPAQNLKDPVKALNQTFALLKGFIPVDGNSTSKLDLNAEWGEIIDDPTLPQPIQRPVQAHVAEVAVLEGAQQVQFGLQPNQAQVRHEFGDTKYRVVKYTAVATTRFREYFESPATAITPEVRLSPREATLSATAFRKVLNSAPPAAPQVRYVIPTFGWNRSGPPTKVKFGSASTSTSTRSGGGLRVYLERPWFSSGDEELLGVVLFRRREDDSEPFFCQPGADPIWKSADAAALQSANFGKKVKDEIVAHPEKADAKVLVAGHKVSFDHERKLWFCDIEIAPITTYFPFVRLALARYQPNSIFDAHLSPIVLTDFAQLAPDRHVTVTRSKPGAFTLITLTATVTGVFAASRIKPGVFAASDQSMEMSLEADGGVGGELGWQSIGEPVQLVFNTETGNSWSGTLSFSFSNSPQLTGKSLRLVIREYEHHPASAGVSKRIVFAETIGLTDARVEKPAVIATPD